jgi:hypothetical protein
MKRQCERQVGVRLTTMYSAVTIPRAVYCPHNAEDGSPFCPPHRAEMDAKGWRPLAEAERGQS